MKNKVPPAPAHLGKQSKLFWRHVVRNFSLEKHHLLILQSACETWDRILSARAEIEAQGEFFIDRFDQPREHPGLKVERDNRILFARLIRELNFDCEPADLQASARPPKITELIREDSHGA